MEHDGSAFLTESQASWVHTQRKLLTVSASVYYPPPEDHGLRRKIYRTVMHPLFERVILAALVLNVICMSITWWEQPQVSIHSIVRLRCWL
jgi:hypothetical protein